jgi:Tol biopolymer transport system component
MKPIRTFIILVIFFAAVSINPLIAQTPEQLYQKGLGKEEGEGALQDAINIYNQIAGNSNADKSLQAKALLHIGMCYEKLGMKEATKAYQRLVNNFPEQKNEVAVARERLSRLIQIAAEVAQAPLIPKFTKIKIPTKLSWSVRLSPDGKTLALVSEGKLWKMPLSGNIGPDFPGAPVQLNTDGILVEYTDLSWSTDGKWIAFNDPGMTGPNQSIYIVPSKGGKPEKIIENFRDARIVNYRISLSSDGIKLAFSSVEENKQHIFTISTKGGNPSQLTDMQAREPAFSPDGKMIAYVEDKNLGSGQGGLGLWIIPATGGTPQLLADAGTASSPIWSPDGNFIAFLDYSQGGHFYSKQINIVPVLKDRKIPGKVTKIDVPNGIGEVRMLAGWTPDNKIGTLCMTKQEFALYTLPAKGGQAAIILPDCYTLQPRYSRNGKQIYYTTPPIEGDNKFYRLLLASVPTIGGAGSPLPKDEEGKNVHSLSYQGGNQVSPDGKWIISAAWSTADTSSEIQFPRTKIWKIAVDGSKSIQITKTQDQYADLSPSWSPNGNKIAFKRTKLQSGMDPFNGEHGIYIIDSSGGEPELLSSLTGKYIFSPVWSPDGTMIAYLTAEQDPPRSNPLLNVINVNNSESRIVGKVPAAHVNIELAWSPDSRRIAFNGDKLIKIINVDDGKTEDIKTNLVDVDIWHLDWSPDGGQFVFSGMTGGKDEFWFLEDFLPLEKMAQKNETEKLK